MGNYSFRLHDIGEGVAEAEIVTWHIKPGDRIEEDQAMVDVMTDKATVELSSPVTGKVVTCSGEIGARVPVGSSLVEIELDEESAHEQSSYAPSAVEAASTPSTASTSPLAAPATRKRAQDMGIALGQVPGTGPDGRITPKDLDAFAHRGAKREAITETKIVGLRRKIAEKMQESSRRIPHFSYVEECDLTELESLRTYLNENRSASQPKLSLLPFMMRALVKLQPQFPAINSLYDDEAGILRSHAAVHIGIATQTDAGLMVAVVRHAETRDLWNCARELARLSAAARDGSATREELSGSTITLTSLGALGGIAATPVINHPEVAIIGPNRLTKRLVILDGHTAMRSMMNLSSSFDHRIIDGYEAARFIQAMKQLLEHPALIFMEANP